jgi:hypothetical protein
MSGKRSGVAVLIVAAGAFAQAGCDTTLTAPGVPSEATGSRAVQRGDQKQASPTADNRAVRRGEGRVFPEDAEQVPPGPPSEGVLPVPQLYTELPGAQMASTQSGVSALHSPNTTPVMELRTQPAWVSDSPFPSVSGPAPLTVKFNLCRSSDPDQEIPDAEDGHLDSLNWQFHFGDDNTQPFNPDGTFHANVGQQCRTEHTYPQGTFTATVSVTDKHLHDQSNDVVGLARTTQQITIRSGVGGPTGSSLPAPPPTGPFTALFNDPNLLTVPCFTPGCSPSPAPDHYGLLTFGNRTGGNQTVNITLDRSTCSGGGFGVLIAVYQDGFNRANPSPYDPSNVCRHILNTGYVIDSGSFTVQHGAYQVFLYTNLIGGTCSAGVQTTITTSP